MGFGGEGGAVRNKCCLRDDKFPLVAVCVVPKVLPLNNSFDHSLFCPHCNSMTKKKAFALMEVTELFCTLSRDKVLFLNFCFTVKLTFV